MESKELRIGNFIGNKYYPNNLYKVECVLHSSIHYEDVYPWKGTVGVFALDNALPIPLTAEWLQRFGFEFSWMSGRALIQKKIKYDLRFVRPYYKDNLGELELDLRNGSTSLNTKVRHVHSLQNLYFALTGEELQLGGK